MTAKELLLKDLCARLPYRVICHIEIPHKFIGYVEKGDLPLNSIKDSKCDFGTCWGIDIDYVRPYLRPMSSMTEEEKQMMDNLWKDNNNLVFTDTDEVRRYRFYDISVVDFLNSHHFDYRGLIEKGLALEAPADMYII